MTAGPIRLQLSRRKGFDLQAASRAANGLPAVNIARPSAWGNPFVVGRHGDRARCVALFRLMACGHIAVSFDRETVEAQLAAMEALRGVDALRGHNLACWCGPGECHADVLLELANGPTCAAASTGAAA